jgi:mRNA interferase YafQ
MRTIKRTSQFKKDYKREKKGRHSKRLDDVLLEVISWLASDTVLPHKNADHALVGEWDDHRDCHIKPDLLLIYRKPDTKTLELVRLGSHSKLGF